MARGPYRFSLASRDALDTCHPKLTEICELAIQLFDFSVVEGHRSIARQKQLYAQGRTTPGAIVTKVDGVHVVGMHNHFPSLAVDLKPYPNASRENYVHLAGIMLGIAAAKGIKLRWGGDWNQDDDFADGWDMPHFEILNP